MQASELSRYLQLLGMAWGDFACAIFLLGASFYAVIALIPAKLLQEVRKVNKARHQRWQQKLLQNAALYIMVLQGEQSDTGSELLEQHAMRLAQM